MAGGGGSRADMEGRAGNAVAVALRGADISDSGLGSCVGCGVGVAA